MSNPFNFCSTSTCNPPGSSPTIKRTRLHSLLLFLVVVAVEILEGKVGDKKRHRFTSKGGNWRRPPTVYYTTTQPVEIPLHRNRASGFCVCVCL